MDVQIIAGNVVTAEATADLIAAGADAVKVELDLVLFVQRESLQVLVFLKLVLLMSVQLKVLNWYSNYC